MVEHQNNAEHPILVSSIYDSLRNTASRSRRLAEVRMFNQGICLMLDEYQIIDVFSNELVLRMIVSKSSIHWL